MTSCWLNIRFLCWHLRGQLGTLRLDIRHNQYWTWRRALLRPGFIYDFNLVEGWKRRNTNEHLALVEA